MSKKTNACRTGHLEMLATGRPRAPDLCRSPRNGNRWQPAAYRRFECGADDVRREACAGEWTFGGWAEHRFEAVRAMSVKLIAEQGATGQGTRRTYVVGLRVGRGRLVQPYPAIPRSLWPQD